jgi:hypothetical protein
MIQFDFCRVVAVFIETARLLITCGRDKLASVLLVNVKITLPEFRA